MRFITMIPRRILRCAALRTLPSVSVVLAGPALASAQTTPSANFQCGCTRFAPMRIANQAALTEVRSDTADEERPDRFYPRFRRG